MCGIAGVRRFGKEPIRPDQLKILLCALEHRGNHATGVCLQRGTEQHTCKADAPAWEFVAGDEFNEFLLEHLHPDTEIALCHTRAATKGTPKDNVNNHPLGNGVSSVVHNGMIFNDDELFKEFKAKRNGEVDSDAIRMLLDVHGLTVAGIESMRKLRGSAAVAACSTEYPGKLLLARSGSPLVLASTRDQLLWASEKGAIHASSRPFVRRFGILFQPNRADLAFITLNTDTAYLLGELKNGEKGLSALEFHGEFKVSQYYRAPNYNMHEDWEASRSRWDYADNDDLPEAIQCPNPECGQWIKLTDKERKAKLDSYICPKCETSLAK